MALGLAGSSALRLGEQRAGFHFQCLGDPPHCVDVGGQDARVARQIARQIADAVGQALDSRRPDTFRRSEAQQLAKAQTAISRAGTRNN